MRLDYLYFNVIICRKSAVARLYRLMAVRLDFLYFIVIFAGSQLWQAVQCTGYGCEVGLSVLHCDISRKSAVAGCTGHGCEAGPTLSRTIEEKTGQDKKSQEKPVGHKMRFVTSFDLNMQKGGLIH